jgi:hypothetical protein
MPRISVTVTQGGADAFVEAELATALTGIVDRAYRVNEISYEVVTPASGNPFGVAATMDFELALSRRSKTAMPNINDADLIKKFHVAEIVSTLAGFQPIIDVAPVWQPRAGQDILIVEDPLFVQLDSTATTATLAVILTLDYEVVSISQLDRLTLLTLSLV